MRALLLTLLIILVTTPNGRAEEAIDYRSCGDAKSILFEVTTLVASKSASSKQEKTYMLDLVAKVNQKVNTSLYQIFVDIELEGFGLQQSMIPKLICDVAEPDPLLPPCVFNDTIRIKLEHTYDDSIGSGIYKVQIRATKLSSTTKAQIKEPMTQCLDVNYHDGDGKGNVLCVDFTKTIVKNWFSDFMKAAFAFSIASAASWVLAQAFPFFRLPIITGYLMIGVAVGPTVGTNLISQFYVNMLSKHINAFALAFIAFAAGEEIFLPDLQNLLRTICRQLLAISFTTFVFVTITFQLMLTQFPSVFGDDDDDDDDVEGWTSKTAAKFSISLLMGSVMAARSPASAVAIVKEIDATGNGTKLMMGITVLSDVVVLLLFSLTYAVASVLCATSGANGKNQSFDGISILILLGELVITVLLGIVLGMFLNLILKLPIRRFRIPYNPFKCVAKTFKGCCRMFGFDLWPHRSKDEIKKDEQEDPLGFFMLYRSYVKGFLILVTGWGVFVCTDSLADHTTDWFGGRRVRIESLLVCMIGACYVSHFSDSTVRALFARILHRKFEFEFIFHTHTHTHTHVYTHRCWTIRISPVLYSYWCIVRYSKGSQRMGISCDYLCGSCDFDRSWICTHRTCLRSFRQKILKLS